MLDEKWVSLQREEQAKEMVKTAVIYEGITNVGNSKRTKLVNKSVFFDTQLFDEKLYDFITSRYDISKIKRINFIGDRALWIKAINKYFESEEYEVRSYCDLFHYEKVVWNLVKLKEFKFYKRQYILNSDN